MTDFQEKGTLYDSQCQQLCEVEYEEKDHCLYLRPLSPADGPVALRSFLLPEGQTFPFQVTVFPVPANLQEQVKCSIIGQQRLHHHGRDTRAQTRVPVALAGAIQASGSSDASIQNLSEGGLMLFSDADLEIGQSFQLELQLPDREIQVALQVRSKIPVGTEQGATLGYGCMFLDLSPETHEFLRTYRPSCRRVPTDPIPP